MNKVINILLLLTLAFSFMACDDDEKDTPGGSNPPNGISGNPATVAFVESSVMALKNAGKAIVPVKISKVPDDIVKVGVKLKEISSGEEGKDFILGGSFVTINKDSLTGYLEIKIPSEGTTTENDLCFSLELTEVFGYDVVLAESDLECEVKIVSNAFITFTEKQMETWEAADPVDVMLAIHGEIKEPALLTVALKPSTLSNAAQEGVHFMIENKTITIPAGATTAALRVKTIDDDEINQDRFFEMVISEISGSNALIGSKNDIICKVIIRSEERTKHINFSQLIYETPEDIENGIFLLPVTMDIEAEVPVVVSLQASDATASTPAHYALVDTEVTIPVGDTVAYARVQIVNDRVITGDRYFMVELTGVAGANAELGTIKNSRITILEDDFTISFEKLSYEISEDGAPLTITLVADENVKKETKVALNLNDITAQRDVNYSVDGVEVVFAENTDRAIFEITPIDDGIITNPLNFEIELLQSDNQAAILTTEKCKITVTNADVFDLTAYSFTESSGQQSVEIKLLKARASDLNLTFGVIGGTEGEIIETLPSAIIEQGNTSTSFNIIMKEDPLKEPPVFDIVVTHIGSLQLTAPIPVSRITTLPCTYRQMLGEWAWTQTYGTTAPNKSADATISAGTTSDEIRANFNKKFVCAIINIYGTRTATYSLYFNKETETVKQKLGEENIFPIEINFTNIGPMWIRYVYSTDESVKEISITFDKTSMTLTYPSARLAAALYDDDVRYGTSNYFYQENTKLIKKQ